MCRLAGDGSPWARGGVFSFGTARLRGSGLPVPESLCPPTDVGGSGLAVIGLPVDGSWGPGSSPSIVSFLGGSNRGLSFTFGWASGPAKVQVEGAFGSA